MELLEGETLASHVSTLGPLSPARAVHIVGQAARALGEAHERGIVHRDVKPENLFLTSLGGEHDFLKVLDFGIAKVASASTGMTEVGCVLGTPAYISPEVASGQEADARSDVYGLGGVLYFLLCGRELPADVETVVMRALEKDPALRYATAAELAQALSSCTLAGTWTFNNAVQVARQSSRPPSASGVMHALPPRRPPAARREWVSEDGEPLTSSMGSRRS